MTQLSTQWGAVQTQAAFCPTNSDDGHDMTTDYAAGVITALVLLALIYFWPVPAAHRRVLVLLWLMRTGVTPRIMLVFVPGYKIDAPLRLWARGDIPPPR